MRTELPRAETGRGAWAVLLTACVLGVLCVPCGAAYLLASGGSGRVFYVDPEAGDDDNCGSSSAPWRTCAYAVKQLWPGDTLLLRSGDYGDLSLGGTSNAYGNPDGWIIYAAEEGHSPEFESITMNARTGEIPDYFIALVGLTITPGRLSLVDVQSVRISECKFPGVWDSENSANTSPSAIYVTGTKSAARWSDITIEDCLIYDRQGGIMFTDESQVTPPAGSILIANNYLYHLSGTAITVRRLAANPENVITIKNNHIYHQDPVLSNGSIPHGSGISIKTSNVTIRGNVIHGFGNTCALTAYSGFFSGRTVFSGIRSETPFETGERIYQGAVLVGDVVSSSETELAIDRATDELNLTADPLTGQTSGATFSNFEITSSGPWGGYRNLLVENNLIYDSYNDYFVILLDLNGDTIIRNNTLVGGHPTSKTGGLWYYTMVAHAAPYCSEGNDFIFKNNIVVGRFDFTGATTNISNNIMYSLYTSGSYLPNLTGNIVVTDGLTSDRVPYFETGDLGRDFFIGGTLFDQYSFTRNGEGGPHLVELSASYQLAEASPAVNFGDIDVAIAGGEPCGIVAENGFLYSTGEQRGHDVHSAGCYEVWSE